jgi:hypothetical protein
MGDVMANKREQPARTCACLTVNELRERLSDFDGTTMVMIPGPEGGFLALARMEVTPVVLNVNADPQFGPHDLPHRSQKPHASALVLRPGG